MKKTVYTILGTLFLILVVIVAIQFGKLRTIKSERDTYKSNTETLLEDVKRYKVGDSINVVSIRALELKASEYENYIRKSDDIIKALRIDNWRLQSITTAQSETITRLENLAIHTDTIYIEGEPHVIRCMDYSDQWIDFSGCMEDKGDYNSVEIRSRESINCIEHVVPRCFLGIKWGIKDRRFEFYSENPRTTIIDARVITIRDAKGRGR